VVIPGCPRTSIRGQARPGTHEHRLQPISAPVGATAPRSVFMGSGLAAPAAPRNDALLYTPSLRCPCVSALTGTYQERIWRVPATARPHEHQRLGPDLSLQPRAHASVGPPGGPAIADDIAFLPATRLIELYREKQLSPVEVIEEALRRLERYESATNA